jgi:glyoxylase-like metal-dependent hydrolase (beta-lactamase superfamily II)/aryl carrier-like protein
MDIDLCDDEGRLAVRLRGLRTRSVPGSFDQTQMRLLTPYSKEEESSLERTSSSIIEGEQQAVATMEEEVSAYFKKQLAALIKVPAQQIDVEAPLSNYGLDSIIAVRFTNVLEGSFGPLSKTLLFEHPTLHSVTEYFLHNYPEQLKRVLRSEEASVVILQATGEQPHDPSRNASFRQLARFLEKGVLKHKNYRKEGYSVILAPNSSLLTGAGTNTIVLGDQSTGAVVIDPATDDPEYLSVVIREGQKYGGIRRILITHGHYDHIGGAEALRAQLGVPILAFSHKAVPFADEEVADNMHFPVGDDMLYAIHTPGHSPDHLCFWLEKQQLLFAGDLITNSGPSLIPPPPEGDLRDYIHSLERVQNLESIEIIPAHGETILGPREMLVECLALCQQRKEQILAAVHDAPRGIDIKTIVQALYKNVDPSLYDFMAISVLSNLVMLEREGRVKHIENKQSEQKDYWILA